MVKQLKRAGHFVAILDNLSMGYRGLPDQDHFWFGTVDDPALLDTIFSEISFDCVMHFAASSLVSESVRDPGAYYRNNVSAIICFLDAMVRYGLSCLVYSSTAAVFGEPCYLPIDERHPQNPDNPYGASQMMAERILSDYHAAYGLNSVCLRYFNAAGQTQKANLVSLMIQRRILSLWFSKPRPAGERGLRFLGATAILEMALASVITSTWKTFATPTRLPWQRLYRGKSEVRSRTTWVTDRVIRCKT